MGTYYFFPGQDSNDAAWRVILIFVMPIIRVPSVSPSQLGILAPEIHYLEE
jgi:hypothetical protein